ncbi:unnamed protein product [Vitrella brassicaformis CCMP3155]|uniref:Uncharacterized protein n=1 Tax=Vitrella brassicaformis (strain CCMP3155) TaxID=1169540 RepID=A0A0G4FAC0_VITBC|nr:unnamed protein product [Vitrella brassicaformis CCMP3155]|eukprot:CEM09933.1 unnamed protein product [Vitrella brassicaformis CCMP3155]
MPKLPKYVLKPRDPEEVSWPNFEDDEDTFWTNYAILRVYYHEELKKRLSRMSPEEVTRCEELAMKGIIEIERKRAERRAKERAELEAEIARVEARIARREAAAQASRPHAIPTTAATIAYPPLIYPYTPTHLPMAPPQPHTSHQHHPEASPHPIHHTQAEGIGFEAFKAKWVRVDAPVEAGWYKSEASGVWELWEATDHPLLYEVRAAGQDVCTAVAFGWSAACHAAESVGAAFCRAVKSCCGGQ